MPGRSPRRHSPPPPPLISRHSPLRGRVRSPEHHHIESRGRERREYRPTIRRSRSPIQTKTRSSYSPIPVKRKAVSPLRERELSRRTKLSKSPVASRGGSDYIGTSADDSHTVRSVSASDRYRGQEYEKDRGRSGRNHFMGPDGSINFDVSELKKFTVEIIRRPPNAESDDTLINRTITNPDNIVPVRRPDEGARPLFRRTEIASTSRERPVPEEDFRRIVAVASSKSQSRLSPERSRERTRYTSPIYEESRRPYYSERPHSPYEARHRSPHREEYIEPKEKHSERRAVSREDLRRDLEVRKRDERRYSPERVSYERESDLRMRINEKRSEPHLRHEEREYPSRRYEGEKHGRSYHSPPPPKEKRHTGSLERHEGSRPSRGEVYEREIERKRRPHSREREESRVRDRYEQVDRGETSDRSRRLQLYKSDYEPKKFFKPYEHKEFIPPPTRGRGGLPIRRGMPPVMRGRGVVRGMPVRGFPIRGAIRGVPRLPFMRGFPPRKSAPDY